MGKQTKGKIAHGANLEALVAETRDAFGRLHIHSVWAAIYIGDLLIQARALIKTEVGHGGWGAHLRACGIPWRTANTYMAMAREWGAIEQADIKSIDEARTFVTLIREERGNPYDMLTGLDASLAKFEFMTPEEREAAAVKRATAKLKEKRKVKVAKPSRPNAPVFTFGGAAKAIEWLSEHIAEIPSEERPSMAKTLRKLASAIDKVVPAENVAAAAA